MAPTDLWLHNPSEISYPANFVIPNNTNLVKDYTFYIVIHKEDELFTTILGPYILRIKDCANQMVPNPS